MNDPILVSSCIIVDDYGRLLLLHHNTEDIHWWETPGGKVEEDETLEDAAVREIHEELGVTVKIDRRLGKTSVEIGDQVFELHWLKATIVMGEPQVIETDKFDDLDYFEIEDLPSLALSPATLDFQNQLLTGDVVL